MGGLVTVITRTVGRPCIADAAKSIAAQTYRPIEWLVVDASGGRIDVPAAGDVPVRVVSSGERMLRARAGNVGFEHARGDRAVVLDDDDLLLPAHVERLSGALDAHSGYRVAYCDVRVDTGDAGLHGVYAFEYSELMLLRRNLFPPNGGMFDMSLVREDGVRYDVALDWFDDWDLWLKMSELTPFLHVREVLAVYRLSVSQSNQSGIWFLDSPDADPVLRGHETIVRERNAARRAAAEARYAEIKSSARRAMRFGRLADAAARWREAHAFLPHDAEPIIAYAEIALAAGEPGAARASIESGLALMPDDPDLRRALAGLLDRAGDADGGRRERAEAMRLEAARRSSRGTPA